VRSGLPVSAPRLSHIAIFRPMCCSSRRHRFAGSPDDHPVNSVTFLLDQQVYIVRTKDGFYAVSAICTHLGCITQWKPEDELIECPCHGSKFTRTGVKVAGPAPRPLPHFSITLTLDGELQVDKLEMIKPSQTLKV